MYVLCLSEVQKENASYIFNELPAKQRQLRGGGGKRGKWWEHLSRNIQNVGSL